MSRFKAFFYHFLISFLVFLVLLYLILIVWYPDFFFAIDGGWEGMRIIIGVDLILGPILTLIVFKSGKPGLKFDLSCIGLLQAVCLAGGVAVVYTERPIYFVYYEKHFYSSSADTFTNYGIATPDPSQFTDKLPVKVISKLPENPIEEADFRRILFQDGIPAWVYSPTYELLEGQMQEVIKGAFAEKDLRERDTEGKLDLWLAKYGGIFGDYAFIPIHSRYRDAFIAIRRSDESFVNIVEVPPPL